MLMNLIMHLKSGRIIVTGFEVPDKTIVGEKIQAKPK